MFVVTGTPRSATGYASLLFTALSVPCSHERIFRPRTSLLEVLEWYAEGGEKGESSWLAWVFLGVMPGPIPVLHTVRNPWNVVDSLAHRNDILPEEADLDEGKKTFRETVKAYCPEVLEYSTGVDRAAALVIHWNRKIEEYACRNGCEYHRYRVEDIKSRRQVERLLGYIGIPRNETDIERALNEVPFNVNAGKNIEYNLEITNPFILEAFQKMVPDIKPVISRAMKTAEYKTSEELENNMSLELRVGLNEIAERYGYSRYEQGVNKNVSK